MTCVLCNEPIVPGEERADIITMDAHRECALRSTIGGIGHLLSHAYFCGGGVPGTLGPDAGLDYRTSALLVDVWVERKGIDAAVRR